MIIQYALKHSVCHRLKYRVNTVTLLYCKDRYENAEKIKNDFAY